MLPSKGPDQRSGITCLETRTEALAMGATALGESEPRGEEHVRQPPLGGRGGEERGSKGPQGPGVEPLSGMGEPAWGVQGQWG